MIKHHNRMFTLEDFDKTRHEERIELLLKRARHCLGVARIAKTMGRHDKYAEYKYEHYLLIREIEIEQGLLTQGFLS